jgi:hypothetical protein
MVSHEYKNLGAASKFSHQKGDMKKDAEDQQTLGAMVNILVAWAKWYLRFVHHCCRFCGDNSLFFFFGGWTNRV